MNPFAVDTEWVRHRVAESLPRAARWMIGGDALDFDFSRARAPLLALQASEVDFDLDPAWAELLIFGRQRFADGGGAMPWLAVHGRTGEIGGLDVERSSPVLFFNSDVDSFVRTFRLFDEAARLDRLHADDLSARAQAIDPPAYLRSEWKTLADHLASRD